jgi:hypothetical protein
MPDTPRKSVMVSGASGGHEPRPARGGRGRHLPPGPLVSPQCLPPPAPHPARARGRHSVTRRISDRALHEKGGKKDQAHREANAGLVASVSVAREHSRTAKRGRAGRDLVRWRDVLRRRDLGAARRVPRVTGAPHAVQRTVACGQAAGSRKSGASGSTNISLRLPRRPPGRLRCSCRPRCRSPHLRWRCDRARLPTVRRQSAIAEIWHGRITPNTQ